jgi:hypothetical protein
MKEKTIEYCFQDFIDELLKASNEEEQALIIEKMINSVDSSKEALRTYSLACTLRFGSSSPEKFNRLVEKAKTKLENLLIRDIHLASSPESLKSIGRLIHPSSYVHIRLHGGSEPDETGEIKTLYKKLI